MKQSKEKQLNGRNVGIVLGTVLVSVVALAAFFAGLHWLGELTCSILRCKDNIDMSAVGFISIVFTGIGALVSYGIGFGIIELTKKIR